MREYITPVKEPAGSSELAASRRSKKPQKVAKKSLSTAFSSVSEEEAVEISKDSTDISPISEISNVNQNGDTSTPSSLLVVDPALSASPDTWLLSDLSPSSVATTDKNEHASVTCHESGKLDGLNIGSVEAEIIVNFLRRARSKVLDSTDLDHQSEKLLYALIELIVDDFLHKSKEENVTDKLVSAKIRIVLPCFMLWILVLAVVYLFSSSVRSSFHGPLPT